jgi:Tol biopolymer transport system component
MIEEPPVWSPDGRQLLVKSYWDGDLAVLLVDLERRIAFKIADNFRPAGWIK